MMRIMPLCWVLAFLLLMTHRVVHAEDGCPPGLIPANGTNINSCAPIPPGYYSNQPALQQPQAQPPIWSDRYGAIAADLAPLTPGSSYNEPSRKAAEQAAIDSCHSNGGVNCQVEISYGNECVALVVGKTRHNAKAGSTIASATESSMKQCKSNDTGCFVYYTACSLPVRIQ
jgi:hypothetical protein